MFTTLHVGVAPYPMLYVVSLITFDRTERLWRAEEWGHARKKYRWDIPITSRDVPHAHRDIPGAGWDIPGENLVIRYGLALHAWMAPSLNLI